MKRLIVLRHGKSDWGTGAPDHERPLNKRGRGAAALMGRLLTAIGQQPDRVITSSATRAATTAELAAEAGHWECPIEVTDALYGTSPGAVLRLLTATGGESERLMLVGHEPTWSNLVAVLTGARVRIATATAVGIDVPSWRGVAPDTGEISYVLPPRPFGSLNL